MPSLSGYRSSTTMALANRITSRWGVFVLVLLSWAVTAQAAVDPRALEPRQLKQTLCASSNTASGSANLSIWQTNGLCSDFCRDKNRAFAIVQYQSCWCSDVAPDPSTEADVTDKCNDICPGYDTEKCGSRPNYYGYIALAKTPTSTAGGGGGGDTTTKAPSTTQAPPAPPSPTTVRVTITETETPQTTTTSDPDTTTTKSTTSTTNKPRTTVQTVTADGTVRTVTVTPTATGTDAAAGASEQPSGGSDSKSGMTTGAVVGVVVGVIAAVVAFAGLGLFLFFRRRKQHRREDEKYDEPSHRGSSAGMSGSPRNAEMVVTVDGGRWDTDAASEQRRSRLMAHDPRMEPLGRGLHMHNKSAESINTLRDDQDYSRKVHKPVLRATNPDPDPQ
ncbi:hypothetical protein CSOJ01_04776 [Colletotrichum sojae]|uniref:WSC domain-containing protein n=1 Tax=Colletotrichum sojae TaxID=2175907 RepID=A0A8H6JIE6_9PEZI|nr:hypothetical protein CSOJ01_04776 [Colletotrichum sojae]